VVSIMTRLALTRRAKVTAECLDRLAKNLTDELRKQSPDNTVSLADPRGTAQTTSAIYAQPHIARNRCQRLTEFSYSK